MDQDEDEKTPRKKAQKEERKEEGIARSLLERNKSDTPSKDKVQSELAPSFVIEVQIVKS